MLSPAPAGESLRCEAEFDPEFYRLESDDSEGGLRLRFEPTGPDCLALLRMKLGAEPPLLRIHLPVDQAVSIDGRLRGSFAALEFAGTSLRSLDLELDSAAATVSFTAPLKRPMDELRLVGDKGSIEVRGLGHASPERSELRQRLGELDLDLRGAWLRDADIDIDIDARLAGGALWLPADGVVIVGLDDSPSPAAELEGDHRPRLHVDLGQRGGRMVVID